MPRIGDQYCVMWDSPTLFERVRGWNLPNLRHHKERRSLLVPLPTPRPMAKHQGFGDL
ncbi:putative xyloglucan endotransglucosylase/hydrolase 18 -like protein [Gossypium arboreum]|uniref:Putative xyloglucan endotransglucosylase/hydrolase 18-like protein n=1 Tax=Gossypium arboreum TaxID=29729 RepID=A0A0B0M819_GOSAR|nr:putative xyloglucan endotransglucosylase/hydrolase 18 -like protein [Gossypium arboreum]